MKLESLPALTGASPGTGRGDDAVDCAPLGAVQIQSQRGAEALTEALAAGREMVSSAMAYGNASHIGHIAGRMEEARLAGAASADAALKGVSVRFVTTASQAKAHAAADILALDQGRVVGGAQVKVSCSTPHLTRELSRPVYRGLQKIAPADVAGKVRVTAKALAARGRRPDLDLADTAKRVSSSLSAGGAKATSASTSRAAAAAKNPRGAARTLALDTVGKAAGSAALVGAVSSAVATAVQGGHAKTVAKNAAKGAADAVLHQGATMGIQAVGTRVVGAGFRRAGAAGAIATVAIGVGADTIKVVNGEISAGHLAVNAGRNTVRAGGAWAGAKAGAAAGAWLGPWGVAVGGVLGGAVGGVAGDRVVANPGVALAFLDGLTAGLVRVREAPKSFAEALASPWRSLLS